MLEAKAPVARLLKAPNEEPTTLSTVLNPAPAMDWLELNPATAVRPSALYEAIVELAVLLLCVTPSRYPK